MAEEKIIRISGDASGFGNEINRAAKDAKEAFSDIGLDELFDEAEKKFDNLHDKIQSVTDELNKKKQDADDFFGRQRESGQGNDYYQRNIDNEQADYNKRHEDALKQWERFVENLKKTLEKNDKGSDDGSGGGSNRNNDNKDVKSLAKLLGQSGEEIGNSLGRLIPGEMGKLLGRGLGNLMGRGAAGLPPVVGAGGGGAAGGAAGAGEAAGAAGAAGGAGMAGAATLAGVAVVVVAVAAVLKKLYGMGMEDWRMESKVNTTFAIDRNNFGKGGDDFGLGNVEYKEYILQAAKSRGLASDIEDVSRKQLSMIRGYGLSQNEVQSFDKFTYQDVKGKNSTDIIVDILARSEKQGILGVSGGDFSRLPEKIEQVTSIMAFQKMSGENSNSLDAVNFMAAGTKIGGRFGDDRAGEVYGRMNESIRNPGNAGMKAYIFEMLKRANPNASFTDLQAKMEDGASGDNLKALLPQIAKMPQGERRRMILQNLTGGNMQDAIRLDNAGSLNSMINMANNKGTSSKETQSRYDEAMKRTETNLAAMDQLGKIIENKLTDFGERFIYRPFNDISRNIIQSSPSDLMKTGFMMTNPLIGSMLNMGNSNSNKENNVPKKTQ